MKRVVKMGISFLMTVLMLMTLAGCGYKAAGDFLLEKLENGYAIRDLSREGYQKKELFIYNEIAGYDIVQISRGVEGMTLFGSDPVIDSLNLEKIYFVDYVPAFNTSTFSECEKLTRIIRQDIKSAGIRSIDLFSSSGVLTSQYVKQKDYLKFSHFKHVLPANVSYFLNYEDAENDGYHWIDDYDYGAKITYIPDDPIREGYTFGGWYKEKECINKWDFEADTLPEIILDERGEPVYQETKLFAKWM